MDDSHETRNCAACDQNSALIAKLEERLTALELEVRGLPTEILLEEFLAAKARRDTRNDAIEEYRSLQRDEFYRKLPELKAAASKRREAYEAFMRSRGFEP